MRERRFKEAKAIYMFMCMACIIACLCMSILISTGVSHLLSPGEFHSTVCFFASVIGTIFFYKTTESVFKHELPMKMAIDVTPGLGYDIHIVKGDRGYQTNKWNIRENEGKYFLEVCGAEISLSKKEFEELTFFDSFKKEKSCIGLTRNQYFALLKNKRAQYKKHIKENNKKTV